MTVIMIVVFVFIKFINNLLILYWVLYGLDPVSSNRRCNFSRNFVKN